MSVNASRRPRARRGEGEKLRSEIVAAAAGLLAELGDARRLTIRAVCAATGVTAPSVYRHFPDKDALLQAVLQQLFFEFNQAVTQAERGARDPFEALRRRCRAYMRFAQDHPGKYRVLFGTTNLASGAEPTGTGEHPGAKSFRGLVAAVQRCIDAGAVTEESSQYVAVELWALLHGIADLRIGRPEFPWPGTDRLIRSAHASLGLRPNE